ncbi:hypothetical protein [Acinetobacter sp.]|uniref:hypothetical protein n=1 Tax=Acinetobacter sp. TaxID=472 RepID=UPI003890A279
MSNLDLTQAQNTDHYGTFLLALPNEQYWECVNHTEPGQTLFEGVTSWAKIHYPHITIS